MEEGGQIVDLHSCEFFPERWFDLVIALTTDNSALYERLEKRYVLLIYPVHAHHMYITDSGYSQKKITENIECEIMQVVVQEANESYAAEMVQILPSNTVDDMESNVERIQQWIERWAANR
jgi:adenylate kinase